MTTVTSDERLADVINDPATPRWVPPLLDEVKGKDIVDVANTLQVLAEIFDLKCREKARHQLSDEDVSRRLRTVALENGFLRDRVAPDVFEALWHNLQAFTVPFRGDPPAVVALAAFTLGYDYHRTYGDLPHA